MYFVYDPFDRPILVQDGNHRQDANNKQWLFTKFDAQNRPVLEGLWRDGRSREDVQAAADQFAATQALEYETRTASGYTTGNTFPNVQEGSTGTLLSQTYYDDYDLNADGQPDYAYRSEPGLSAAEQPAATGQTRGYATVTRRRVVQPGGQFGPWLTTAVFYDQYGNVIQKQGNNLLQPSESLLDVTTLVYREQGFVPQILRSVKKQHYGTATPAVVRNRFAYDPAGHLLQAWQQNELRGTAGPEVLLSRNRYEGLGELTQKKLHSRDETNFLQHEDFAYDQHGQLTRINRSDLTTNPENDLFGMELAREQANSTNNTPRYDGGISAVSWTAHNAAQQNQPERERSYRLAYDGLGRFVAASYAARDKPWEPWDKEVGAYDEDNIWYDLNGNIQAVQRYTQDNASSAPIRIDRLYFNYKGNQLNHVGDLGDVNRGFKDRYVDAVDYKYDANGNVTRDDNKQAYYAYNTLNKVERQTVGAGAIAYTYDASGTVVRKETTTTATKNEYYVDGFVYEYSPGFAELRSVPTPEGRAVVLPESPNQLVYEYHLRDHLGNLRVAFRTQGAEELKLTSEDPAAEEGPYPKFRRVAATQSSAMAYRGSYSAAVSASQAGPSNRVPVAHGDRVSVEAYYATPAGLQYRDDAATGVAQAPQKKALALALAPGLLPVPQTATVDGVPTSRSRVVPALQLSLTGLLAGRAARPAPRTSQRAGGTPVSAYLRWTLYNSRDEYVRSGTENVPGYALTGWQSVSWTLDIDLSADEARTGYLVIQPGNDGAQPVYFDELTIRHPKEQLVVTQENHYYPLGMAMTGVAVNTAAQAQPSKDQFNGGSELQDELLGAENGIYSTFFRSYDPTIGRFQGVDPLADTYADQSPYSFAFNDPVNFNDPRGDDPIFVNGRYVNPYDNDGGRQWNISTLEYMAYQQREPGVSVGYGGFSGHLTTTSQTQEAQRLVGYDAQGNAMSQGTGEFWTIQYQTWVFGGQAQAAPGPRLDWSWLYDPRVEQAFDFADQTDDKLLFLGGAIYETQAASLGSPAARLSLARGLGRLSGDAPALFNQGLKRMQPVLSKVGAGLGYAGAVITFANTFYKAATGTANTSTWVDAGVTGGLLLLSFTPAAPLVVLGLGVAYGAARFGWGDQIDAYIDRKIGYR